MKTLKEIWVEAMGRLGIPPEDLDTEAFDKEIKGYITAPPLTSEVAEKIIKETYKTYHFDVEE